MSFNISINRSTNEERIYINAGQSAEVWIKQCEPDPSYRGDYTINTSSRDIHEFNTAANTIADAKYEVFTDALGLNHNGKNQAEYWRLAPDFQTIKAMATGDVVASAWYQTRIKDNELKSYTEDDLCKKLKLFLLDGFTNHNNFERRITCNYLISTIPSMDDVDMLFLVEDILTGKAHGMYIDKSKIDIVSITKLFETVQQRMECRNTSRPK
tara:strand:+ start:443 stop:1078 length:636 start_codon:yes stop_codon:yes gene_type:complete